MSTDPSTSTGNISISLGVLQGLFSLVNMSQDKGGKQQLKVFGANDVRMHLKGDGVYIEVGSTRYNCFEFWALGRN